MSFTVYTICVIALASLVEADFPRYGQLRSNKTGNILGIDELNSVMHPISSLESPKYKSWIFERRGYVRNEPQFLIKLKGKAIYSLQLPRCYGSGELDLNIAKPFHRVKGGAEFFELDSKKSGKIYGCNGMCLYVEEATKRVKAKKNCDDEPDHTFFIVED
uniref:Uncharacterized protein LOC114348768 n=1 Tax=Diabrotica virgifera virgifera TaxID=50390 RepID=A0A6P7HBL8_DIAVI